MTPEEFRSAMNAASHSDTFCVLWHVPAREPVVAVGLDSAREVAFLFKPAGSYEVPLAELVQHG